MQKIERTALPPKGKPEINDWMRYISSHGLANPREISDAERKLANLYVNKFKSEK